MFYNYTICRFSIYLLFVILFITILASDIEIRDVRNDSVEFSWNLPKEIAAVATSVSVKGTFSRNSSRVTLQSNESLYTFRPLVGNTTYRISVEAFFEKRSIWYSSTMVTTLLAALDWLPPPTDLALMDKGSSYLDISWKAPLISHSSYHHVNQHAVIVYLFVTATQQSTQIYATSMRMPMSRIVQDASIGHELLSHLVIGHLEPGSVYNVTIKAGTDYGYGATSWIVVSTLTVNESQILRLDSRTPNSLTVFWPITWLNSAQDPFTIRAHTIHSLDGSTKEVSIISYIEPGRRPEYTLKHLTPGTTFNVTLSTNSYSKDQQHSLGYYHDEIPRQKTTWAAFSTLPQGEYLVTEARIAAETDTSVSIVFRGIEHDNDIFYELRYYSSDDENSTSSFYYPDELLCPKFGCGDWSCALFYNLRKNPRNYIFEIRANVDDQWNKWAPVSRRPWNLMEKVCSITPPQKFVENIDRVEYMRTIRLPVADLVHQKAWRYFIVVDRRGNAIHAPFDIPKLSDKATAEHERVPYYITAAFSQEAVYNLNSFIIGDGKVYGGYLNYPLSSPDDPSWTIIPVANLETEILEKSRTWCGMELKDDLENEITVWLVLKCIPLKYHLIFWTLFLFIIICCSCGFFYFWKRKTSHSIPPPSVSLSKSSSFTEHMKINPTVDQAKRSVQKPISRRIISYEKQMDRKNHTNTPSVHTGEKFSDEDSLFYMGYDESRISFDESMNHKPKNYRKFRNC